MGCGEFLVKYILFFANLFFALAGLVLLGLGVAVQLQVSMITNLVDGSAQIAPISAMVVGGLVFVIAFFGCCGAIRESNCMLVTYAIFMLILMVLKVTLATVVFVKLPEMLEQVATWLDNAFKRDPTAFQEIEKTFYCCGTTGPLSYGSLTLPETCCASQPCLVIDAYDGCTSIVQDFFNTFGLTIGIITVAVAAIELVAVVFALCLANQARNRSRRSRY